jgi:LPS sulfotransferase NodH
VQSELFLMQIINTNQASSTSSINTIRPEQWISVPFVILFVERSGSSFLATLLESHHEIHCQCEIFPADSYWINEHKNIELNTLEEDMNILTKAFSYKENSPLHAKGFKIKFPSQVKYYPQIWDSLLHHRDKTHFIALNRNNVLKQSVSTLNRNRLLDSPTREYLFPNPNKPKIHVDATELVSMMKTYDKRNKDLFASIKQLPHVLSCSYEDLLTNESETLKRILAFLQVDSSTPLCSNLKKVTPDNLDDIVENMDEIKQKLSGTKWEKFIYL